MELNYRPGDIDRSYSYARNSLGKITHIENSEAGQRYICIECGTEMIPRRGEEKIWHFAHKTLTTCSGESWLHGAGKELFVAQYQWCLIEKKPFNMKFDYPYKAICERNTSCQKSREHRHYVDLTMYYTHIETEKRHGNFIPDIRLYNPDTGNSMYVEIAVTHRLSEEKKRSGHKIIEIQLKDKKCLEKMTKSFSDGLIDCTWIRFVNIKKPAIQIPEYEQRPCVGKLCETFKYEHHLKLKGIIVNAEGKQMEIDTKYDNIARKHRDSFLADISKDKQIIRAEVEATFDNLNQRLGIAAKSSMTTELGRMINTMYGLIDAKYDRIAQEHRNSFQSDINREKQLIRDAMKVKIDELNQSAEAITNSSMAKEKAKIINMMADFGYDFEGVVGM
jgi:ribosomal protein L37AE/L43A